MKILVITVKIMSKSYSSSFKFATFRGLLHISFGRENNGKPCGLPKDHSPGKYTTVA